MADDFPSEFDAIVLGTGLPESVIAAALARVGKSVLHLDRNDYYSSDWATFTFDGLLEWIKAKEESTNGVTPQDTSESSCNDGTKLPIPQKSDTVLNIVTKSYFRTKRKGIETTEEHEDRKDPEKNSTSESSVTSPENVSNDEKSEWKDTVKQVDDESKNDVAQSSENNIQQSEEDGSIPTSPSPSENASAPSPNKPDSNASEEHKPEQKDSTLTGQETVIPVMPKAKPPAKPPANKDMTYEDLKRYFRQFNIDIAPKMLFSRGPLVEAIISANISHYAEFKSVGRVLTYLNGNIEDVPCSRSDVFSSTMISAIEKRTLMKFLTFCIDFENHEDEYSEYANKPFVEFLQSRRLSANLQHFVLHAIAMLPPETETVKGLATTRSFLQSLGRYGNTPFIWPLYGVGELPQAFCRMCAVFGGLYCLRRGAETMTVDNSSHTCSGITSDGKFLKCKLLIVGHSYLPEIYKNGVTKYVSRGVFITDKSLKPTDNGAVTLMSMPRTTVEGCSPVTVIELDKTASASPSGLHVVHLTTDCCDTAEEDLKNTAEELLHFPQSDDDRESSKPVVLWSLYFNQAASYDVQGVPNNVYSVSMPGTSLGFSHAMNQAKLIFQSICGEEEEFLPAIPNPEDIIMDDIPPEQGNHAELVGGVSTGSSGITDNPENPTEEQGNSVGEAGDLLPGDGTVSSGDTLDDRPVEEKAKLDGSQQGSTEVTAETSPGNALSQESTSTQKTGNNLADIEHEQGND